MSQAEPIVHFPNVQQFNVKFSTGSGYINLVQYLWDAVVQTKP